MKIKLLSYSILAGALLLSGCARLAIGTGEEPPDFSFKGWGKAYIRISDIPEYNGNILDIQLMQSDPHSGELVDISLWPLLELDLGLFGIRGKLLAFEAAAGTLFYYPDPETPNVRDLEATTED
jgi:hypothetical protein